MKTLVLFLFGIFSLIGLSSAQTVFAPQGAVWHYYFETDWPSFNLEYKVEKDTVLGGQSCVKVIGKKVWISGKVDTLMPSYFYTSGDTVLYFHDSLKNFTPIYIFNVKKGDTLTLIYPASAKPKSGKPFKVEVLSVDVDIIDGIPLRTVNINALDFTALAFRKYTERVGAYFVADLLPIAGTLTADHREGIRCYRDKEIDEKFVSDKWDCDYVPTGIDEALNEPKIQIFPNPAIDKLTVKLPHNVSEGQYKMIGMDGRILIEQDFKTAHFEIDLSSLSNGIYFLQLHNSDFHLSKVISVVH